MSDYSQGQLRVSEETNVDAGSFLELAGILGKFHEVITELKAENEKLATT